MNIAPFACLFTAACGLGLLLGKSRRGRGWEIFIHPFSWLCLMSLVSFYKRGTLAGLVVKSDLFVTGGLALMFLAFAAGFHFGPAGGVLGLARRLGWDRPPERAPFDGPRRYFWIVVVAVGAYLACMTLRDILLYGSPLVLSYSSASFSEASQAVSIRWFNRFNIAVELVMPALAAYLFAASHVKEPRPGHRLRYGVFVVLVLALTLRYFLMGYRTYLTYLPIMFLLVLAGSKVVSVPLAWRRALVFFGIHAAVCAGLMFVLPVLRASRTLFQPVGLSEAINRMTDDGEEVLSKSVGVITGNQAHHGGGRSKAGHEVENHNRAALVILAEYGIKPDEIDGVDENGRFTGGLLDTASAVRRARPGLDDGEVEEIVRRAKRAYLANARSFNLQDWAGWIMATYGTHRPHMGFWRTPRLILLSFVPKEAYAEKPNSFGTQLVIDQRRLKSRPSFGVYAGPFGEGFACGGWPGFVVYTLFFGAALGWIGRFAWTVFTTPGLFGRFEATVTALCVYALIAISLGGDVQTAWKRSSFTAVVLLALLVVLRLVRPREADKNGTPR